jgi:hypothetical protein
METGSRQERKQMLRDGFGIPWGCLIAMKIKN